MKKRVFVDTNFFLLPSQFGVDVFSEIERVCVFDFSLVVVSGVFDELQGIVDSGVGSKDSRAAVLGLALLRDLVGRGKIVVVEGYEKDFKDVDEHILSEVLSSPGSSVVCTQDRVLRDGVKSRGGGFIFLRGKSHLVLENC